MPTTSSSTCSGPRSAASTTSSGCGRSATTPRSGRARRPPAEALLLHIIARGKIGRSPEAELTQRYLKRIAWPTKVTELGERAPLPDPPANSVSIALDERGAALSSAELASKLDGWRNGGRRGGRPLLRC